MEWNISVLFRFDLVGPSSILGDIPFWDLAVLLPHTFVPESRAELARSGGWTGIAALDLMV